MYIPIWIVIIGVIIYFFWNKNKKRNNTSPKRNGTSKKFVGRHQQLCLLKKFLGEEIPDLELQIAVNKDNTEREDILRKLEEMEKYIKSDIFTNHFDVVSANKNIRDLIGEGYKTCVLTGDTALENRCFKILNDTNEYLVKSAFKNNEWEGNHLAMLGEDVVSILKLEGLTNHISLGGLLKDSSEEQKSWIIFNTVSYSNNLVRTFSSLLAPEPAEKEAEGLKSIAKKLFSEKKINNDGFQKTEREINEGLILGKEN